MIDLGSRKLAGWAMADHMRTELVEDALTAAWRERGSLRAAVFHSDHESVYTSKDYTTLCQQLGVLQSMGAIGSSADNALAESFNAALKRELLDAAAAFPDAPTTYRAVFRWSSASDQRLLLSKEAVNGITNRLRARVHRDFPVPEVAEEVLRLVYAAAEDERVQAAIVLSASGDLSGIRSGADLAIIDWRDVLVNGGLANESWNAVLQAELGP